MPVPFSPELWTDFPSFKSLPILKPTMAITCFWLALASIETIVLCFQRPVRGQIVTYVLLGLLTWRIGKKQYDYYYREKGGSAKDGIFVDRLRQASDAEEDLDVLLSVAGGALAAVVVAPQWWFLVMSAYSFLVALRCYVTMNRDKYWIHGGAKNSTAFIPALLYEIHNGLVVGEVVSGWVFSHVSLGLLGLVAWYTTKRFAGGLLFDAVVVGYFLLYYAGLRQISVMVGRKLWMLHVHRYPIRST